MADLELDGHADGPAPWGAFAILLPIWVSGTWAASEFVSPAGSAVAVMMGVFVFWALLPKAEASPPIPGWTVVPLFLAFVAGLFLAGSMSVIDEDLAAAGYGVWFVLWLQLGLWMRDLDPGALVSRFR